MTGTRRAPLLAQSALARARDTRGWTQQAAAREYTRVASELNIPAAEPDSLRISISRWERGEHTPDEQNRKVLRRLYNLTDEELGLTSRPRLILGDETAELAARLASTARVDVALIGAFDQQTQSLRLQDRTFGAASLLDQMSAHIHQVQGHLGHSMTSGVRAGLARVLADAGALAGWQALDAGAAMRAWEHFNLAKTAAREAGEPILLAHAIGEQAYALLEVGDPHGALDAIKCAAALGPHPPLLTAWLAAAEGEFAAASGSTTMALRAFDRAQHFLPAGSADESLPFLALNDAHLTRWRGSALTRLGNPEAIEDLTHALNAIDQGSFVRALAGLHTDLATAYAVTGDRDQARTHIRLARSLAAQIGSQRLLRRLDSIPLPGLASQDL
ncbi:MAG: helix-turn-helix domain-containing protein [Microbacterium sp.]|uniref:helix-turn-helix domain-containing protein n=1 Tax=Microbacterium sp. TaxID=51671 RepID=UPI003F9E836C